MYGRIMVPLDGSAFGEYALPAATELARRSGASLELVHVHRHREYGADLEGITPYRYEHVTELEDRLDGDAWSDELARMNTLAEGLRAQGMDVVVRLLHDGSVARTLAQHARENGIDFVVMTTHGRSGARSFGAGSVALSLVHDLEVPVLVLRPDGDAPARPGAPSFRHVLIPLDGTPRSEDVLPAARELAYPFGSGATLLRVIEHGLWPMNVIEVQVEDVHRKAAAHVYLDRVAQTVAPGWTRPDVAVTTHRSVAQGILEAAEQVGADLIAIATHGRTGMARMMMGSVAAEVLHDTRLPLLLFGPAASSRRHAALTADRRIEQSIPA